MAGSKRRGFGRTSGGAGPNLRGTLGTLLRTTMVQVGSLREVVERSARDQREWIDQALLTRRRREALAVLGEALYDAVRAGAESLDEVDGLDDLLADIAEIDEALASQAGQPPGDRGQGLAGAAEWMGQFAGRRFDDRDDGTVPSSSHSRPRSNREPIPVWRPTIPPDHPSEGDAAPGADADATMSPAGLADLADLAERGAEMAPPASADRASRRPRPGKRGENGGGIAFGSAPPTAPTAKPANPANPATAASPPPPRDALTLDDLIDEDDDLEQYMHEDDLPRSTKE